MQSCTLELNFDPPALMQTKLNGRKIFLAKSAGGANPNVICLSFDPVMSNTVSWGGDYGIFASLTALKTGNVIQPVLQVKMAKDEGYYAFSPSLVFSQFTPSSAVPKGTFAVKDDMTAGMAPHAFGMLESMNVNAGSTSYGIISVVPGAPNQMTLMTPDTNVYVWVQGGGFGSGSYFNQIPSHHSVAKFSPAVPKITMHFDANTGLFV